MNKILSGINQPTLPFYKITEGQEQINKEDLKYSKEF
jgi:hypothetical protein